LIKPVSRVGFARGWKPGVFLTRIASSRGRMILAGQNSATSVFRLRHFHSGVMVCCMMSRSPRQMKSDLRSISARLNCRHCRPLKLLESENPKMLFPTACPDSWFNGWLNPQHFAAQRFFIRRNLRRFALSLSTFQDVLRITNRPRFIASMEAWGEQTIFTTGKKSVASNAAQDNGVKTPWISK